MKLSKGEPKKERKKTQLPKEEKQKKNSKKKMNKSSIYQSGYKKSVKRIDIIVSMNYIRFQIVV